ncbi:hypothetical protein EVAR_85610_1 [Eumeta japonica]|uniref:Uncharacterized protein n=1 Tax=Eumeta variegata TaxID=151549 RepID=A0A4C1XSV4_EUMVA|nr:hypothetical protein EVAR_85610_1 [Eumeta japonica]
MLVLPPVAALSPRAFTRKLYRQPGAKTTTPIQINLPAIFDNHELNRPTPGRGRPFSSAFRPPAPVLFTSYKSKAAPKAAPRAGAPTALGEVTCPDRQKAGNVLVASLDLRQPKGGDDHLFSDGLPTRSPFE